MSSRDPYRDDPYGDGRDGQDDEARPGRRHATRPARPAWDAMTYGVPADARRPSRAPEPTGSHSDTDWTQLYGAAPAAPTSPPPPSYANGPPPMDGEPTAYPPPSYASGAPTMDREPTAYPPSTSYPAASSYTDRYPGAASYPDQYPAASSYPATSYPPADTYSPPPADSYAPDAYTTFRSESAYAPPGLTDESEPIYVAAGLYLDEEQPGGGAGSAPGGTWTPAGDASAYPGGLDEPSGPPTGGRNVPAAVAVGLGLGTVVLTTLFLWRPAFLGVIAVAVGVGIWELVRAVRGIGVNAPLVPLIAGGALMTGLAWWGAADGLTFGLMITVVAVMVWRFAYGVAGYGRDVTMATLVAVYIPFLGGFATMLASAEDGQLRILATLIAVVLSDTGGYIIGSRFGRHPLAPSVSPKKSWEGLGGSLVAAALGSAVVLTLMFGVELWWGMLFGLAIAVASVVGDLGESMVKRDLGVKDMSGLLPGHGGVMDRLDSILLAAPTGYVLLTMIAPMTS